MGPEQRRSSPSHRCIARAPQRHSGQRPGSWWAGPGQHVNVLRVPYIEGLYNSVRLHSRLGNLPTNAFEQQSAIKQPITVADKT